MKQAKEWERLPNRIKVKAENKELAELKNRMFAEAENQNEEIKRLKRRTTRTWANNCLSKNEAQTDCLKK